MHIKISAIKWIAQGYKTLTRKKSGYDYTRTQLAKVFSTFDLTMFGIGSTLGIGIYILAGQVAKETAGPAVTLSFFIAGIASLFAALCYAEIGPRVPKAGSAYNYSYVTVGEFMAFFIGWNMILEYAIGAASVAKALSEYLDSLLGYTMRDYFTKTIPISVPGLSDYPDVFAFAVTILVTIAVALGARESCFFNNIFTLINLSIIGIIILTATFEVNSKNWQLAPDTIPPGYGTGGYMPYGMDGVLRGAAICFYGFIGFDSIANAGEETKYPRRSIPLAFCISIGIIFAAYLFMSMILTMVLPYYDQDANAPILYIYQKKGWVLGQYFILIGAGFGLSASLIGSMFPLPRVILAMATDGLLFKCMGKIHERHKTPFIGTLVTGFITAVMAMLFDLTELIKMMSIGTLLAYTMVACSVMILRYQYDEACIHRRMMDWSRINDNFFKKLYNYDSIRIATGYSSDIATWGCALFCVLAMALSVILNFCVEPSSKADMWLYISIFLGIVMFCNLLAIRRQPCSRLELSFRTPGVPWLPGASIFINLYLTVKLDSTTWLRFLGWIVIGFVIYFVYGIWNSEERKKKCLTENSEQHTHNHQHQNGNANQRVVPVITISESVT